MLSTARILMLACSAGLVQFAGAAEPAALEVTVKVDADAVLRTMDPRRLGGTNVAMWYYPATFDGTLKWMPELNAKYIRMPGGSWANGIYWNGHGVRGPDGRVDPSKVGPDGYPAVDYSDYAPSFRVNEKTLHPESGDWHGHSDVKKLHDFIKAIPGTEAMVCPNAGTGRAVDAAEWVKWANGKMGYGVRMWEIGNELGGSWEAGTEMPLGKGPLTAEIYTARYNEMAAAMRKMDPTIKIGSSPYVREVLRDCGDLVDFVSQHTYPGSRTRSEAEMFAEVPGHVAREVGPIKGWIREFQPKREGEIEICYSEWNLSGGLDNARMFTGLWSSIFLGELAKNGVAMATQWDAFSDLFAGPDDGYARKAQFYALSLWNNYMGEKLISAASSEATVFTYASKSDDAVTVMLINTERDRDAKVNVAISGFSPAAEGEVARVTSREYSYDSVAKRVRWSRGARVEKLATGAEFEVMLAPYSITYVRVPSAARPGLSKFGEKAMAVPQVAATKPELKFSLPEEVYAGDTIYGELLAVDAGSSSPFGGSLAPASLSAGAGATLDREQVRLSESVGHFHVTPSAAGELTISAKSGEVEVSRTIKVKASVPRPIVFWDFSVPPVGDKEAFSSDFKLHEDLTQRANRAVVRIDLADRTAVGDNGNGLLKVNKLPGDDKLNKSNIRGVVVDSRTSPDFRCDDPNAHIMVVMQSTANWWMVVGRIPLKDAAEWKTHAMEVTDKKLIEAMPAALNVIFVLQSNQPARGSIYLDRVGLMVR